MKRFAAFALLMAGMSLPVCAQRGGGHGGFSGHGFSGSGFSSHGFSGGGFSSAPSRFSGNGFSSSPRFAGSPAFRSAPSSSRAGFGAYGARSPYYGNGGYRSGYLWRNGVRFSYRVPGWIGAGYLGYPYLGYPYPGGYYGGYDDSGYDDSAAAANDAGSGYYAGPGDEDQSGARTPYYQSYPSGGPSGATQAPMNEDAVTVVFKDGRPSEQIHNYALSRTTLYVLDEHHRDIPVNEIDLAATEKVNQDAGVDFQLPASLR